MRTLRLGAAGGIFTALAALAVPASASALTASPPVTGAHILVHFDLQAGQQPENITLAPGGAVDVTFALTGEVAQITRNGAIEPLATMPPAPAGSAAPIIGAPFIGGIVRAPDGTLFVNYSTGTADLTGIWAVRPGQAPTRIAALPATSVANGLAAGPHGMLYVADSNLGVIWRVPERGGAPVVWASSAALAPSSFLGANGIKVRDGAVWVTNTDAGTILRIPVGPGGAAGPIQAFATGLAGIDDFNFAGQGRILAALNLSSELALVQPDGTHTIVLTAADGLSNPTSVAVRGRTFYVPSAAYMTRQDPNLLVAHLGR